MSTFLNQFGAAIENYWSESDEQQEIILNDILQYAGKNPEAFRSEMKRVIFDEDHSPLSVVFEALSKDTANWSEFFVETLDHLFIEAKKLEDPQFILYDLSAFTYLELDESSIQRMVDRLYKEINSDIFLIKIAALWTLPSFLTTHSIRNRQRITGSLREKLNDPDWRVRYVAYKSLGYEDLLPEGYKLSIGDRLRKMIYGAPPVY